MPIALLLLTGAAYAAAVYWSSLHPSWLTLVLAMLPLLWCAAAYAKKAGNRSLQLHQRLGRALPLLGMLLWLALYWDSLMANFRLIYLAQHVAIHAALAWAFGLSLLPGRVPLCTEMASWVHENMDSPRLRWYTRQVTGVWAVFFAAMTAASLLLYALAPAAVWTTFSAVLGPVLTLAVFVLENAARHHFLLPHDRVGLLGTWRAVRAKLSAQQHP